MRLLACMSLVLLTLQSTSVLADAVLSVGNGVSVIAHNGKELSDSDFLTGSKRLQLNNGTNQVLVRYSGELSGSDGDIEHSHAFVLLFNADDNQSLSLSAPRIRKQRELDSFNQKGNWNLQDSTQATVAYQHAALIKEGFQLSRDYAQELAVFNQTQSAAALQKYSYQASIPVPAPVIRTGTAVNTINTTDTPTSAASEPMSLQMLKYWYNQADSNSRANFKAWINQ